MRRRWTAPLLLLVLLTTSSLAALPLSSESGQWSRRDYQPLQCRAAPDGVPCDEETNACYAGAFTSLVSAVNKATLAERNRLVAHHRTVVAGLEAEAAAAPSGLPPPASGGGGAALSRLLGGLLSADPGSVTTLAAAIRALLLEADTTAALGIAGVHAVSALEAQLARGDAAGRLRVATLACVVAPLLPRHWGGEVAVWGLAATPPEGNPRSHGIGGYTAAPALLLRAFDEENRAGGTLPSSPVLAAVKAAMETCRPLLFPAVRPAVGRVDMAPVVWNHNSWERVVADTFWCDGRMTAPEGIPPQQQPQRPPVGGQGAGWAARWMGASASPSPPARVGYVTGPYNRLAAFADGDTFHLTDTNMRAHARKDSVVGGEGGAPMLPDLLPPR